MKITFVSQPLSTGGAERVVAALSNGFSKLGHNVSIAIIENGDINTYYISPEVRLFFISKPKNHLLDLINRIIKLRRLFKKEQPDIIIPFTTQKNVSVLLATLFSKFKVICCERNNPSLDPKSKALRFLRKVLYWTSDGFVFQTENARSFFSEKIQKKSCIIFNPLDDNLIEPWIGQKRKTIVMVNRINQQKNIELAIDSFAEINKKYPDYNLEIYGKSDAGLNNYESVLKRKILDLGFENKIIFKGFHSDVHQRIADASIFLITSNHEGMSNSLMEAMALGLVCISTDDSNGGARALISSFTNGILIPVGDVKSCVDAIDYVISNPSQSKAMSQKALLIREELSIDVIVKKWLSYINSVIKCGHHKNYHN